MPFLSLAFFNANAYKEFRIGFLLELHNPILFSSKYNSERKELMELISNDAKPDVKLYQELVSSGKLYKYLMEQSGVKGDEDSFKEMFFYALFDKAESKSKLKPLLNEHFPTVMRVFDLVKTGFVKTRREGRTDDEPTNALCMILYNVESNIEVV